MEHQEPNNKALVEVFVNTELRMRNLELADYDKGYMSLLEQLTTTGSIDFLKYKERFEELSVNKDHVVLVVENLKSQKIVASGTLLIERKFIHANGKVGHIEDIVVDKESRGNNLGKHLVDKLCQLGEKMGCYKVILNCNEKVVGFYEKCNFKTH